MIRSQMLKFKSQILMFLIVTAFFLLPTASAQTCSVQDPYPRVRDGLISTPDISGSDNFRNNIGKCVFDPGKTAFAPYKIPSYDDLKSLYFDQSKSTRTSTYLGNANQGTVTGFVQSVDTDRLIYINGSLTISGNGFLNGKPNIPIIVFVKNDLTINNNIDFAHTVSSGGLVFVVGDDVNIDKDVTQINAVIISSGIIYTAGAECATSSEEIDEALTVYGSLISLNQTEGIIPIKFCRKLAGAGNDTDPAEIIKFDPKYLVILRNLFADTLQKWSEIQ